MTAREAPSAEPSVCRDCGWPLAVCSCGEDEEASERVSMTQHTADMWERWADSIVEQIGDE